MAKLPDKVPSEFLRLGSLKKGDRAQITEVEDSPNCIRLLEMGLLEGTQVEIVHEAPFGGDPIAVRVRDTLIALRRNEANQIRVKRHE